jgi:hypothetical protein
VGGTTLYGTSYSTVTQVTAYTLSSGTINSVTTTTSTITVTFTATNTNSGDTATIYQASTSGGTPAAISGLTPVLASSGTITCSPTNGYYIFLVITSAVNGTYTSSAYGTPISYSVSTQLLLLTQGTPGGTTINVTGISTSGIVTVSGFDTTQMRLVGNNTLGQAIQFNNLGGVGAGLSTAFVYYVASIPNSTSFGIATTLANAQAGTVTTTTVTTAYASGTFLWNSITDSSTLGRTVAIVGNCISGFDYYTMGGSELPGFTSAIYFKRINPITYLRASPTIAIGTQSFTFELWFKPGNTASMHMFGTLQSNQLYSGAGAAFTNQEFVIGINAGQVYGYIGSVTTGNKAIQSATAIGGYSTSTWYHIAWTRDSTTNKHAFWVNGNQQTLTMPANLGTLTDTSTFYLPPSTGYNIDGGVAKYLAIGGSGFDNSAQETTMGYMTNFRVSIGVCRYTANFAVPTGPFTG